MNDDLGIKILIEMLKQSQLKKFGELRYPNIEYFALMDNTHRLRFLKCVLDRVERERLMPSNTDPKPSPSEENTTVQNWTTALRDAYLAHEKAVRGYVTAKTKQRILDEVHERAVANKEDKEYKAEQLAQANEVLDNLIHHIQHASPEIKAALKAELRKRK